MNFRSRLAAAVDHEMAVRARLIAAGWLVEPYGQGNFSEPFRRVLLRIKPETYLRWSPDMIAARDGDKPLAVLIDAKWTLPETQGTPNHCFEQASVEALKRFSAGLGIPAVYVMFDFGVVSPDVVEFYGDKRDGANGGNGSGTPYYLLKKRHAEPFQWKFGGNS